MSSLFDQSVRDGNKRVVLLKVRPNYDLDFRVTCSFLPRFNIHFMGVAFICPGIEAGCPACGLYAPRHLGYLVGGKGNNVELVEVGRPTLERLQTLLVERGEATLQGSVVRLTRKSSKRPALPEIIARFGMDASHAVSQADAIAALARIFSLPATHCGESFDHYEERIRPVLLERISRRLLGGSSSQNVAS